MMTIKMNNKNVVFVRKDKTLFDNKWKNVKEHTKTGFVYMDETQGVSILPFRFDKNGKMEVLIREEPNPLHQNILTAIGGKRDDHEVGEYWWQETAQRELGEESGYWVDDKKMFSLLGDVVAGKDYKDKDVFCTVDLTGIEQGKMKPDKGSIIERKAKNFWVSVDLLKRMVLERAGNVDSYFLAMAAKFLVGMGQIDKSEEIELKKANIKTKVGKSTTISSASAKLKGREKPGHKYIRREGSPGSYKYIYEEPKGRKKKEEEPSKERGLLAQLAELFGAKPAAEKEKKTKKIDVLSEYSGIPKDIPDFAEGVSAEQWLGMIDKVSNIALNQKITEVKNSFTKYFESMHNLLKMSSDQINSIELEFSSKKIKSEDKTLDAPVQKQIVGALTRISRIKAVIDGMTGAMNSSIVENSFLQVSGEINAGDKKEDIKRYESIKIFEETFDAMILVLKENSESMADLSWLAGEDKRLDFMIDQTFKSVDALMKTRNRFILSTFKFFVEKIDKKLDNLNDSFSIESVLSLINGFDSFNYNSLNKPVHSRDMFEFTNQWNLKQNGVYDAASRYLANAKNIVVEKFRDISENINSSPVVDLLIDKILDNKSFNFLTLSGRNESFPEDVSEQSLAYIDMFGLEKYKRDMFFMFGSAKSRLSSLFIGEQPKAIYDSILEVLDKTFAGVDVYNDENTEEIFVETFQKKIGDVNFTSGELYGADIMTLNSVMNTTILLNETTPLQSKIPAFIRLWSEFSHGSLATNMMEEMTNRKGIDRGSYVNYHLASNRSLNLRNLKLKEILGDTVEQIYSVTQKQAREDIGNEILLYRGNGKSEVQSTVSSWSKSIETAANFGDHVVSAKIPAESIFMYQNAENEDYWSYAREKEHLVIPGLLPADKKIETVVLSPEEIEDAKINEIRGK